MTSWIWMKGIDYAIVDTPIEPVTSDDERPIVKDLIDEYRVLIDEMKLGISDDPLYDSTKHDDLWCLRFILSHCKKPTNKKGVSKAIDAAKYTLQFRVKHNLDDKDIRDMPPEKIKVGPVYEYWRDRCQGDGILTAIPDKKRGVIMFIKFAQMNPNATKLITEETWDYAFIYSSEYVHQWLDYVTRTTGRLTKSIRFIDMKDLNFVKHFDRASSKRDGKIMNEMEDCYPQLLESIYPFNAPTWMHLIWEFMRPIMPTRILDKIDIIQPDTNKTEKRRLYKHIHKKKLPTFLGGKNETPIQEW